MHCSAKRWPRRTARMFTVLGLLLVCITTIVASSPDHALLEQLVGRKESVIAELVRSAESAHAHRCSPVTGWCDHQACSVPACGSGFDKALGFTCREDFGSDVAMCEAPGLIRSLNKTVVRVPPGADFASPALMEFVCSTETMDTVFTSNHATGRLAAWQYMGHATGAIRIYPGAPQSRSRQCDAYDARQRPWYVSASSGPKDVVIVVDVSGSMENPNSRFRPDDGSRLDVTKAAIQALLGTMTQNDFVAVVAFATESRFVGSSGLVRASTANIKALQRAVGGLQPEGQTYFIPAFEKAFDALANAGEATSSCTRVILFLTDGYQSGGITSDDVTASVRAGQARLRGREAHIFTYSLSSDADDVIPRAIACGNQGAWARINDGADPLTDMGQYYQFLASGIDTTVVRWSAPYEDSFGMGQMVTAAQPVYDRSTTIPLLIGVVGTDVLMSELEAFAGLDTVVSTLIARGAVCPVLNVSACQLQHLRESSGYTCPHPAPSVVLCNAQHQIVRAANCAPHYTSVNDLLCQRLDPATRVADARGTADVACCGGASSSSMSEGELFAVVIGVVVGVALVLALTGAVVWGIRAARAQNPNGERGVRRRRRVAPEPEADAPAEAPPHPGPQFIPAAYPPATASAPAEVPGAWGAPERHRPDDRPSPSAPPADL